MGLPVVRNDFTQYYDWFVLKRGPAAYILGRIAYNAIIKQGDTTGILRLCDACLIVMPHHIRRGDWRKNRYDNNHKELMEVRRVLLKRYNAKD